MIPIESNSVSLESEFSTKRISWAAIFAGAVVALVVHLALSVLGIGIGASTIDPLAEGNPFRGMGTGSGIWLLITTLISLFAGGWVAGRVSGTHQKVEGSIHGFLAWGIATLVTSYLLASAVGGLWSGASSLVGGATSVAGQAVKASAPAIGNMISGQLDAQGIDLKSIQAEARTILRQTGKVELQPDTLEQSATKTQNQIQGDLGQAAKDPQNADAEFTQIWNRVIQRGEATLNAADKEAMVNILLARSDMSREEATTTVNRWESTFAAAKIKFEETKVQAEQKAREVGDSAAEGVSKGAIWSFIALLLGSIAAGIGGLFGATRAPYFATPVSSSLRGPLVHT